MTGFVDQDQNPFAAPESDLVPEEFRISSDEIVYGSLFARAIATVVDGVILMILWSMSLVFVGTVVLTAKGNPDFFAADVILRGLPIVIVWLYFAVLESSRAQATLGKHVMDLRVMNLAGERIGFLRATARLFGALISGLLCGLGFLVQPFTERKQALHDILTGCIVIKFRVPVDEFRGSHDPVS